MLERTTRSYFEDILSKDFSRFQDHDIVASETKRGTRHRLRNSNLSSKINEIRCPSDEHIMTRKTRNRRPRIPAIQSGYCAVCSLPYNSVEDHIQSKKHQKLIGEDANYIALNGSLNGFLHTNNIPFLNLNGVDAIGVHDTSLEELSKYRRRNMPRNRVKPGTNDRVVKPSPLSPTGSDTTGHHLRSRRNINYMTPPLDDDSLQEQPDLSVQVEPVPQEYKEYRELRSSTRALAKLTEQIPEIHEEVWESGRPKRSCIKQRRKSTDDSFSTNLKTYYKVEVLTPKLRSSHPTREQEKTKRHQSQSPKRDEDKDKALIVKFKKLRNSELIQLNNEATNFLFPKKDGESSEEGDDGDGDETNTTISSVKNEEITLLSSDTEDCHKNVHKFKEDDDASMDSSCSGTKTKKKRRTHAEAFIMDNQKYYKFETPGSRLRYHGTYLPTVVKSPKHNGECVPKAEVVVEAEEPDRKKAKVSENAGMKLENYKFSFEKVPKNESWYTTFQRQDRGEQRYMFFSDYFFRDPFILPYQLPSIKPLDPKTCFVHYNQLLKLLQESLSEANSVCSSPAACSSSPSVYEPDLDEDSKMSLTTLSSTCSLDESKAVENKMRGGKSNGPVLNSGKKPRKSPRQHASTLAILSSFLQQRRRRSKNKMSKELKQSLPVIPEETSTEKEPALVREAPEEPSVSVETPQVTMEEALPSTVLKPLQGTSVQHQPKVKAKVMFRKSSKPKIDYFSIASQIDDELDTALDEDLEKYDLDISEENTVDFHNSKSSVEEILRLYDTAKSKETVKSCRRFFNGTPGRKPGRRKKMNKTGWPNKSKRHAKREQSKEKEDDNDDSTLDSLSVNMDSEEEICEDDANSTDSNKKGDNNAEERDQTNKVNLEENCDVDRVEKHVKILTNKVTNSEFQLQPYVFVQKLDSDKLVSKLAVSPKRTSRKQRHMPGSPKSPRMLRKPRGRWYRER